MNTLTELDPGRVPGCWRTARKEYACHNLCGVTIRPADRYFEYFGATPCWQSGERFCALCGNDMIQALNR